MNKAEREKIEQIIFISIIFLSIHTSATPAALNKAKKFPQMEKQKGWDSHSAKSA